jgi:hypothetical protein
VKTNHCGFQGMNIVRSRVKCVTGERGSINSRSGVPHGPCLLSITLDDAPEWHPDSSPIELGFP